MSFILQWESSKTSSLIDIDCYFHREGNITRTVIFTRMWTLSLTTDSYWSTQPPTYKHWILLSKRFWMMFCHLIHLCIVSFISINVSFIYHSVWLFIGSWWKTNMWLWCLNSRLNNSKFYRGIILFWKQRENKERTALTDPWWTPNIPEKIKTAEAFYALSFLLFLLFLLLLPFSFLSIILVLLVSFNFHFDTCSQLFLCLSRTIFAFLFFTSQVNTWLIQDQSALEHSFWKFYVVRWVVINSQEIHADYTSAHSCLYEYNQPMYQWREVCAEQPRDHSRALLPGNHTSSQESHPGVSREEVSSFNINCCVGSDQETNGLHSSK